MPAAVGVATLRIVSVGGQLVGGVVCGIAVNVALIAATGMDPMNALPDWPVGSGLLRRSRPLLRDELGLRSARERTKRIAPTLLLALTLCGATFWFVPGWFGSN